MQPDTLATKIADNRKAARKLDLELCALLRQAAKLANEAGHISDGVTTLATEPKEP